MSREEKQSKMQKMTDEFFASMTSEAKKELTEQMMPKMMEKMIEGMTAEDKKINGFHDTNNDVSDVRWGRWNAIHDDEKHDE